MDVGRAVRGKYSEKYFLNNLFIYGEPKELSR